MVIFDLSFEQKRRPFDRAFRISIGARLREARKRVGYGLEEVANAVEVTRQSVVQWETGKAFPTPEHLYRLIDLYQVSVESLLKGDQRVAEGRAAYIVDIEQMAGGAVADLTEEELRRIRDQVRFMVQQARRERQSGGEDS